jgi:hypothetical protein
MTGTQEVERSVGSPGRTIETNEHCTEAVLTHASRKQEPIFIVSTREGRGESPTVRYSLTWDSRVREHEQMDRSPLGSKPA